MAGEAPLIYKDTNGNKMTVKSGGIINVETGGELQTNGVAFDLTQSSITAAVAGVAASYKIARGATALDGSNPTPVTTGLTTVVAATVSLRSAVTPGVGTSVLTVASTNYASGALAVYAWKVTAVDDATLIASTGTETFEWVAVGT